jgi:hypothetical protein
MNDRVQGEASPEASGEHSLDGRWLTYGELGHIRGIGRESAVKLAQRKRWRRIPGNDGVARVLVPLDWLTPAKEPSGERSPQASPEHSPELPGIISAFDGAIAVLREQLDQANIRAVAAEARADRLEQAIATERSRADRAEATVTGERARADQVRDRIEVLQMQLATAEADGSTLTIETAELTAQLNQARRQAQEAQDAAEVVRQAEAERRARGLLARLRAAWRGN